MGAIRIEKKPTVKGKNREKINFRNGIRTLTCLKVGCQDPRSAARNQGVDGVEKRRLLDMIALVVARATGARIATVVSLTHGRALRRQIVEGGLMGGYPAARGLLVALAILGWVAVIVAISATIMWMTGLWGGSLLLAISGIPAGLVTVAGAQIGEAVLDIARHTRRTADAMETHAAMSRADMASHGHSRPEAGHESVQSSAAEPTGLSGGGSWASYKGVKIARSPSGWVVDGQVYATRIEAMAAIEARPGPDA